MASLAEHLSGPTIEIAPTAPVTIAANLAPIGLFCIGLTLFAFSCSILAYSSVMPPRR